MNHNPNLYKKIVQYTRSDYYPFHMPGHKRHSPYSLDLTEIEGFDNLHHAQGVIAESMEWAASLYGSHKTYYLVNGSSGGILSAISGVLPDTSRILLARNCHKAAYHGVILKQLDTEYVYPQFMEEYGIQCGLSPENIRDVLKDHRDIRGVFVVSPTYDGVVSDIKRISQICHGFGIPLIVDEAHGAHFPYGELFPVSALELGADVVIQSVHKTLPCFTQSALLHIREGYVDRERIERYLQIFQSSSPSYLLLAGIEQGIHWMVQEEGRAKMREFSEHLLKLRQELGTMKHLKILGREVVGIKDIYDIDLSKIIISTKASDITGTQLYRRLREEYHLEMEMCTEDYVTAITTVMDTEEGLRRLGEALIAIDKTIESCKDSEKAEACYNPEEWKIKKVLPMNQAWNRRQIQAAWENSPGRIAAELVYVYPPGIPIVAPGEQITESIVKTIMRYQDLGLFVEGMKDKSGRTISVVAEGE